jgi:hypothetical protein
MTDKSLIIHVRFNPDGSVLEIGERPTSLTGQQWYEKLCHAFGSSYEALSGGRGVFRVSPDELSATKAGALH